MYIYIIARGGGTYFDGRGYKIAKAAMGPKRISYPKGRDVFKTPKKIAEDYVPSLLGIELSGADIHFALDFSYLCFQISDLLFDAGFPENCHPQSA